MKQYFIEARTRKYVKGHRFLPFARNLYNKYKNQLLDTGLDLLKTVSKKEAHKTGQFLGNKIADVVILPRKNCENKTCLTNYKFHQKKEKTKQIETNIIEMEHFKISNLLNDSTVSKFLTKRWIR